MSERAAAASFVEALAKLEELQKAQRERDEYKKLYTHLREENERLKRGLLGKKAEKLPQDDAQLSFAILGLILGGGEEPAPPPSEEEETRVIPEHTRKVPKRRGPSDDWPRVYIELVPPEVEREGLDAFDVIGQESRGVLERRPASCVFVEVVRKKFVRKADKGATETSVLIADPLALPIAKGIAGPGLLAETVVKRWCDHQPLHRQESIFARDGLELARSTLSEWHMALALLAAPLIQAMKMDAFQAPYLCTDATGVLVQAPERCKNGHFWVLVAPEKHVLFEFSKKHDSDATAKLLDGYKGYLVADAHVVYDHLYRGGQIIEVGCWSHTRRYCFNALASDPDRAKVALAYITALFKLERTIADEPRKKKEAVRDKKSRPIVQDFFNWCEAERDLVLDDSPIAAAIGYAINQRKALERFLDDGRLPMTETSERKRSGEKTGSSWAPKTVPPPTPHSSRSSPAATARPGALALPPRLVLSAPRLAEIPSSRTRPRYFQQTLQQEEAKRRLAQNPLRRALLAFAR